MARHHAEPAGAAALLVEAYRDEVFAEALLGALAEARPVERARLEALAALAQQRGRLLAPAVARLRLDDVGEHHRRQRGASEAAELSGVPWSDVLAAVRSSTEQAAERYRELHRVCPPRLVPVVDLSIAQHVAIAAFARAETEGDPTSVDILSAVLDQPPE